MKEFDKIFNGLFVFFIFSTISFNKALGQANADSILNKTFDNINIINTLKFYITSRERINDSYIIDKGYYKISKKPILYYYKQIIPATGVEVLLNNKTYPMALVNTNKTLLPNLKLSPYGEVLRNARHHNLYQAGYDYFKNILLSLQNKYKIRWSDIATVEDHIKIGQYNCYKITLINPYFKIIDHIIKEKTTPQQLALKLNICDHHILQLNSDISSIFQELKMGHIIKIPNDYAYKIILYIDKKLYITVKIEVYDNIGLFEEYLFDSIEINPTFKKEEYFSNYKDYGF